MSSLTYATRKSPLALAQSRAFARALEQANPGLQALELTLVTAGDRHQDRPLQDLGGKGLFVKELEEALLDGRADFAVHSIKDVPAELPPGLELVCIPLREDPRDALLTRERGGLDSLRSGAKVGTSSLRRGLLLRALRPDVEILPLRGNVDTRLRKLESGEVDAILLAHAGLRRLGLEGRIDQLLSPEQMLPAVGQGALGIEARSGDDRVLGALRALAHTETSLCVSAERAVLQATEGNCRTPLAAYAERRGDTLWLRGMLAEPDGSKLRFGSRSAPFPSTAEEARALGADLGAELLGGA